MALPKDPLQVFKGGAEATVARGFGASSLKSSLSDIQLFYPRSRELSMRSKVL